MNLLAHNGRMSAQWQIQNEITKPYSRDQLRSYLLPLLFTSRGISEDSDTFLSPPSPDWEHFPELALDRIHFEKFKRLIGDTQGEILVYGDYDADGICASAIMTQALRHYGKTVRTYVPDRRVDGYGMKPSSLVRLIETYPDVELVITVDQGIVAHDAVDFLKQQGKHVIVTDHHHAHGGMPDADLIIHTTATSGSGVAWLLSQYGLGVTKRHLLELASIGTITDLLPLRGFNRSVVTHGLSSLATTDHVGLLAMLEVCGITASKGISSYHVGFQIGPRFNAAGRLELADPALDLLMADDMVLARDLAATLDQFNKERQAQTLSMVEHAMAVIDPQQMEKLLMVESADFDEGIIGLVASKLVEKYHRPTIVMAVHNGLAKGSARSISGVSMVELLGKGKDLYDSYGGHVMAGGFTIKSEHISQLRKLLLTYARETIDESNLTKRLKIDAQVPFDWVVPELAGMIEKLAPFGMGNPKPVFAITNIRVKDKQLIGNGKHLKLWLGDEQRTLPAIGFGLGELDTNISVGKTVDVAFAPSMEEWNGRRYLQLGIQDIRL